MFGNYELKKFFFLGQQVTLLGGSSEAWWAKMDGFFMDLFRADSLPFIYSFACETNATHLHSMVNSMVNSSAELPHSQKEED